MTTRQRTGQRRNAEPKRGFGDGLTIGVVVARFNREITERLEEGALRQLSVLGVRKDDVRLVTVPGAVEVPLAAKALLMAGVDGVIALGCVIRGETTHYESVCASAERGCTLLQLEFTKPVVFGVLTVENVEQALDRVGGHHGHKGEEAADVVVEMCNLLSTLKVKTTKRRK